MVQLTYNILCDKLNSLFQGQENIIKKHIETVNNIKCRVNKFNFLDALIHSFLYTQKGTTKNKTIIDMNQELFYNKNTQYKNKYTRTGLYEKSKLIDFDIYNDIFNKVKNLHTELFSDDKQKKFLKRIAIDGTYNNTNIHNIKGILETSLNLGFFDIDEEIPIDLTFEGLKINSEITCLTNYIKNNKDKFNNIILILDRGYCSNKLIRLLNNNNIKFICRFRNNYSNDKIVNNIRVIDFKIIHQEKVKNNEIETFFINKHKFDHAVIEINNNYKLITNLDKNNYNDTTIKDFYFRRWDIEVFFGLLKGNFNFSNLRYTNLNYNLSQEIYKIFNIKTLTMCILSKIFEKAYIQINNIESKDHIKTRKLNKEKPPKMIITKKTNNKKTTKKKDPINVTLKNENIKFTKDIDQPVINNDNKTINQTRKCINKLNHSLIIKLTFNLFGLICKNTLTSDILMFNYDNYVKIHKRETNIKYKRVCKTPFYKWYIKGYSNHNDFFKIIKSKLLNDPDLLNSNLKSKAKNINIIKINFID